MKNQFSLFQDLSCTHSNQDYIALAEGLAHRSVEESTGLRDRITQICSTEFLTKVQKQLIGGKIAFSLRGDGINGHP